MIRWIKSVFLIILLLVLVSFAAITDTFFAVHCEPTHTSQYGALVRMVALADSMKMFLTIEFSPQYADTILKTPSLLAQVRSWQLKGHEVAAHHHDLSYNTGWDGFTNHPAADIIFQDLYRGSMADYFKLLSRVAGDSLLLTGGITDWNVDWPVGLPYRTEGHNVADALSEPVELVFNGQKVTSLSYGLVNVKKRLDSAMVQFSAGTTKQVLGLVQHEADFNANSSVLRNWFVFLAGKGVHTKTVRTILGNRKIKTDIDPSLPVPTHFQMLANYPNPFNNQTRIQVELANTSEVTLQITNLLGQQIALIKQGRLPTGRSLFVFDASAIPSGEYFIILETVSNRTVGKMVLLR